MSLTYPLYTNSNFPDAIDQFDLFSDVTLDMLPYVKQYQSLYSSGKFTEAAQLLIDHPEMKNMIINSANLNKIIDALKCIETLYSTDIQTYIMELITYKGFYSSKTKYSKYDVVTYTDSMVYMCTSFNCPMGTLPVDTTYFIPLTMRGEQGEPGIGLTNYGEWNSVTAYPKDALVSYNNTLWAAVVSNTSIVPSSNTNATWSKVIEFSAEYTIHTDKGTETRYQLIIDNGKLYLEEVL